MLKELKKLNEISDEDIRFCQTVLKLESIPNLYFTKKIVANIFAKGTYLDRVKGLDIIKIYNYLKDKYELPI